MSWFQIVYLAGVAVGLLCTDGSWRTRIGLALVWPLGVLAFAVTLSLLLVTAMIAFPFFGVAVVAVGLLVFAFR